MGSLFNFVSFRFLSCILPFFVRLHLPLNKKIHDVFPFLLVQGQFQSISIPVRLGFDAFLLAVAFSPDAHLFPLLIFMYVELVAIQHSFFSEGRFQA